MPQSYAQLVRPGQPASIRQAELQGRTFTGEVARTAASIDAATRTMQVEIALPNKDAALLPGAFVEVGEHSVGIEEQAGLSHQKRAGSRVISAGEGRGSQPWSRSTSLLSRALRPGPSDQVMW